MINSLVVTKPLRVCRHCGVEAFTEEDLETFLKSKEHPHGRTTQCKTCFNKYRKHRRDTVDRVYLRHKYADMIQRCYYPKYVSYSLYGGRGITVCDKWLKDPDAFIDWALSSGWRRGLELDRINGDGPYSPDNCRWSTHLEQQHNRRYKTTFPDRGTRICSRCKVEKPLTEFHRDRHNSQGHTYACRACRNKQEREKEATEK